MEFALGLIIGILVFIIFILVYLDGKENGYKQGQIDALNNKQNYYLIEFEDGVREYRHEDELKDLEKHKII